MFWKRHQHASGGAGDRLFVVIHPLDDAPEQKVDTERLGRMPMTTSVRISLLALRVYLLIMVALVVYRVLDWSGILRGGVSG